MAKRDMGLWRETWNSKNFVYLQISKQRLFWVHHNGENSAFKRIIEK